MKWLTFIFFCLLLATPVWADWGPSSCADTTVISSLPHTISSSGCYRFSGNLNAGAGSGLLVSADSVSVFFEGDTIWYGNSTNDSTFGLKISYGADSTYICGPGAIISQAQVTGSDTAWDSYCLKTTTNSFIHIDTLNLVAKGGNAKCLRLSGGYGIKVTRCRMTTHCRWYKARDAYDGAPVLMIGFEGTIHGIDDFYHLYFANNVIDSCHHAGMRLKGVVKLLDNEVHVSAVNLRYPTGGGIGYNSSNAYCYVIRGCNTMVVGDTVHQTVIRGNVGYAYNYYYGSDGLFEVEKCHGTSTAPVLFENNKGYIHRGWDPEYTLAARGIAKIRPEGGLNKYLHFKHDSCWVYSRKVLSLADSASEWSSYGEWATGFYIIANLTDTGNIIESCYVRSIALLDTNDGDWAMNKQGASGIQILGEWQTGDWVIRDNNFECNHSCIRLGYGDAGSVNWDSVYDNTFTILGDTGAAREYLFSYCARYNTYGNNFLDNDVNPDSAWEKMYWYGAATQNARIRRTLDLYVEGNNSLPVSGCSVFVWNDYGDSTVRGQAVAKGITGVNGYYNPVVSILYEEVGAGDSLNAGYCDFRFKAFYHSDPDSVSTTYCVKAHQYTDTLTLSNTAGQGAAGSKLLGSKRLGGRIK